MRQKSIIVVVIQIAVRVLLVTAIFTLLGFAIGLFCGIGAGMLYGLIRNIHPDMTLAYRFGAVPFAALALVITFIGMLVYEVRHARLGRRTS